MYNHFQFVIKTKLLELGAIFKMARFLVINGRPICSYFVADVQIIFLAITHY